MTVAPTLFRDAASAAPRGRRALRRRDAILHGPAPLRPPDPEPSHPGGGLTLDDLVVGVWEGLSAHRTVPCPACGGAMTPRYGSGPGPVGGRCGSCRTTIR